MKAQHVSSGIPLIIRSTKLYLQPLVYISMWWPAVVQPGQRPVTTWVYKPQTTNTVWNSWWWAVCRSKHVKPSINFGIINSITRLYLVDCLYWLINLRFPYNHHLVVCLTTGLKPLQKPALHIVRSRAFSFKWKYPFLSLRSFNSFLHLLPCLPVTYIPLCIFPSIIRCRRQFLRKMWPIQFAFRLRISCRIFLCSLPLSNTTSFLTWSVQLILFILLHNHISELSRCFWSTARSVQVSAPYKAML